MSVTLSKTSKNTPLLIYNGFSYTIDQRSGKKIYWRCEHAKKYGCHERLYTDLNNIFIKTIGEHENHTGDPRAEPTRQYYERLQTKSNKSS